MNKRNDEKGLIESLRDGIDVVRLILFKKLKEHLRQKYPAEDDKFCRWLAAAVVNELFGTNNPERSYKEFAEKNASLIDEELSDLSKNFPDLKIPITDALRMHFLCNQAQGLPDYSASLLARAKELGILIEEREVPLPRGFMNLVHKIGIHYKIIRES